MHDSYTTPRTAFTDTKKKCYYLKRTGTAFAQDYLLSISVFRQQKNIFFPKVNLISLWMVIFHVFMYSE